MVVVSTSQGRRRYSKCPPLTRCLPLFIRHATSARPVNNVHVIEQCTEFRSPPLVPEHIGERLLVDAMQSQLRGKPVDRAYAERSRQLDGQRRVR